MKKNKAGKAAKNTSTEAQKALDSAVGREVTSDQPPTIQSADSTAGQTADIGSMNMSLQLTLSKANRKSNRLVVYNIAGRTGSVQFLSTLFGGTQTDRGNPPETLTLEGTFAEPKAKVEKVVETKEERKARMALLPKLTPDQKLAKLDEKREKLAAKIAKKAAKTAAPAETSTIGDAVGEQEMATV